MNNSEQDLKVEQKCKIRHKHAAWYNRDIGIYLLLIKTSKALEGDRARSDGGWVWCEMSKDPSARPWQWRCDWCLRRWWRGWCLTMKALLLFVIQIPDAKERAAPWLRPSGPWTLGGGLLIFFPHISSLPDTYYFLCLGAMAWIHLTPPACMNKYTPTKFAVAPPFIVQGLTESIFVHPWFEWTVWTNNCIKHSRWLIVTRPQPHKCITLLPVVF